MEKYFREKWSIEMILQSNLIEVKGDTKIECLRKCRKYEDNFEYVTKIHEVTFVKGIFKYNPQLHKKNQYAGTAFQKYYRAFMRLKPKEEWE